MKKKIKVEMCICTCAECPYFSEVMGFDGWVMNECTLIETEIRDASHIQAWCPLEDLI